MMKEALEEEDKEVTVVGSDLRAVVGAWHSSRRQERQRVARRSCLGRTGDFGIARSLNNNHFGIKSTHIPPEHIMGTQVYMVPECIRGELSTKVDIFAFGFVVLETLTGSAVSSLPLP